jgi:methylated-DNA-[protein]-cysteine S-methyltransferase
MALAVGRTAFASPLGALALAWSELGIVGLQLPTEDAERTLGRLARRFPATRPAHPPASVRSAIDGVLELLSGAPRDLAEVAIDVEGAGPFDRGVWEIARAIPPGATRAYGDIARDLGDLGFAREVGQSLGRNPVPIIVPCHRVLATGGKIGGFSAFGGVATKRRLLAIEAALATAEPDFFR